MSNDRLKQTLHLACLWLALQGLLHFFLTDRLALWFSLRWQLTMLPLVKQLGLLQLGLAFLLWRTVTEPRRQALAVDVLLLLLLGKIFYLINFRLRIDFLVTFEKVGMVLDVLLSAALLRWRTRSKLAAPESGALAAKPVLQILAEVRKDPKSALKQDWGSLEAGDSDPLDKSSPPVAKPSGPSPAPPKGRSESLPRMD